MRDRLIELIERADEECKHNKNCEGCSGFGKGEMCMNYHIADYLLANGVIVTPCVAMVEQFIKDGKFDRKHTAHNGRYAVVYVDKSKWNCPLIDITEQFYNAEKAEAALAERGKE